MSKSYIHTTKEGDEYELKIRKYTPSECFRLMGVRQDDIDNIIKETSLSDSNLYQLAGNSIVTNCMTAIFDELLYPTNNSYVEKDGQLSLF